MNIFLFFLSERPPLTEFQTLMKLTVIDYNTVEKEACTYHFHITFVFKDIFSIFCYKLNDGTVLFNASSETNNKEDWR